MLSSLFQRSKNNLSIQIGLAENEQYRCVVMQQNREITDIQWHLTSNTLQESLQAVSFSQKFTIIRPLPYQYIWRKSLFLPLHISKDDIHKQVISILKQQIPLPIQQLVFDYYLEEQISLQRLKLVIYAIRKDFIATLIADKYPTRLDCELYCYLRAFHHLLPESQENILDVSYHLENLSFQFKNEEILINPETSRYQYYIEQLHFPEDIVDKHLYLKALGASLWNGTV